MSLDVIYWVLISGGSAWCILKNTGEERKKFEEEDIQQFRAVEIEEDRLKFPEEEINDLQHYMTNNLYTKNSSNTDDTIRKRDIHGKFSYVIIILQLLHLSDLVPHHLHR